MTTGCGVLRCWERNDNPIPNWVINGPIGLSIMVRWGSLLPFLSAGASLKSTRVFLNVKEVDDTCVPWNMSNVKREIMERTTSVKVQQQWNNVLGPLRLTTVTSQEFFTEGIPAECKLFQPWKVSSGGCYSRLQMKVFTWQVSLFIPLHLNVI